VMLPKVAVEKRAQERFLRETVNTQALRHPHVVQVRDSGCSEGTFFFTLEFCDGGSVDKLMKQRGGKLGLDEALPIILQVLDGLAYAHQAQIPHVKLADGSIGKGRGLVHRDLKPPNIMLSGSGKTRIAKVGDYGLSKAFDTAGFSGLTATGTMAGTPFFMPRQQVLDFLAAKPEVDVWAAAASLYHMLTGFVPRDFRRETDPWLTVLSTSAVPIRQRLPSLPARLAEAIDYALIDKPEIKVRSAPALKQLLHSAV
jgi:eukaryotic-like serine/threonine-protein kinase